MPLSSTVRRLFDRECFGARRGHGFLHNGQHWHPSLVEKIGHSHTFEGHNGCVNSLKWNRSGTLLASGSDDRTLKIWNLDGEVVHSIDTGHTQNVFAVDFLPNGNDNLMVSAAGDSTVRLHYLEYSDEIPYVWNGDGRVKRLATAYDEPFLLWSASEDSSIRQYDTRSYDTQVLLTSTFGYKSLAICENRTELLAAAPLDSTVPIYDRRFLKEPMLQLAPADHTVNGNRMHYPTHVAFDSAGTEVIVNMGGGCVYVFDITEPSRKPVTVVENLKKILDNRNGPAAVLEPTHNYQEERGKGGDLFGERRYSEAIDLYSYVLASCSEPHDRSVLLANKAAAQLGRHWEGDVYGCVRDCVDALECCPNNAKAMFRLVKALVLLEQWDLAASAVNLFKERFPKETCINNVQKDLKLEDPTVPLGGQEECRDYKERYNGHTNIQTDIKEANFFGGQNEWIVAGSDCGSLIIWDRKTGILKAAFAADADILNIVQPHPTLPLLATSGIEDVIRLWEPLPEGTTCERKYENPWEKCGRRGANFMSDLLLMSGMRMMRDGERPECVTS